MRNIPILITFSLLIKCYIKKVLIFWNEYLMFEFHLTFMDTNSVLPDPLTTQFWPYEGQKVLLINSCTSLKDCLYHRQFYTP